MRICGLRFIEPTNKQEENLDILLQRCFTLWGRRIKPEKGGDKRKFNSSTNDRFVINLNH
jgi:hypothetical protein